MPEKPRSAGPERAAAAKAPFKRVVLDTEVVIAAAWEMAAPGAKAAAPAAFLSPAPAGTADAPRRILDCWRAGRFKLVVSPDVLKEYQRILELKEFLKLFTDPGLAVFVEPKARHEASRDPSDNMFLDCSAAGNADCLVSTSPSLLAIGFFSGALILKPEDFLEILTCKDPSST